MTTLQAMIIAIMQGASELFPISSLGHAVLIPWLLGWRLDELGASFLPFLVMLHVGTGAALLAYFWRDWTGLATGVLGLAPTWRVSESRRIAVLIIVATLPAVVLGGVLEHTIRRLFATPALAAIFLMLNGMMLFFGEHLRGRMAKSMPDKGIPKMKMADAFFVGCWQCLALLPGMSRSGATMVGGLLQGVNHEVSAHFSFLIAFPIILAATVLEIPKLLHSSSGLHVFGLASLAAIVAAIVAFLSLSVLMRYFRSDDRQPLRPFAIYCFLAGGFCAAFSLFQT